MGRYDTSLYLKAQVDNLTGHNEELRQELKEARFESTKLQVQLDKSHTKVPSSDTLFHTIVHSSRVLDHENMINAHTSPLCFLDRLKIWKES